MSYFSADFGLTGSPRVGHAWTDDDGGRHVTVHISESSASVFFIDGPAEAKALAAVFLEAAAELEKLPPGPKHKPEIGE